jgi:curved DNA-binding protein CbpA
MFKDYYKILGVSPSASDVEIKQAYREMSIKWHPDRNPEVDVTEKMQDINEAYAILKDVTKRTRYNQEYVRFCGTFQYDEESEDFIRTDEEDYSQTNWSYYYDVQDEELKEDIRNAQKYARELVEEFLKNLKETSKMAAKGAATNAFNYAVGWVLAGIFLAIVGSLIRACN